MALLNENVKLKCSYLSSGVHVFQSSAFRYAVNEDRPILDSTERGKLLNRIHFSHHHFLFKIICRTLTVSINQVNEQHGRPQKENDYISRRSFAPPLLFRTIIRLTKIELGDKSKDVKFGSWALQHGVYLISLYYRSLDASATV